MKEVRCPFCGRENTRGKYCMFCGNTLAGSKPVSTGGNAGKGQGNTGKGQEENGLWNPEQAYGRSGRRLPVIVLTVVAAAAIVIALAYYVTSTKGPAPLAQAFTPPLGTPGARNLEEMTKILEECGLERTWDPYQFSDTIYQDFAPSVILGEKTVYSTAAVERDELISVWHVFEEEGRHTIRTKGPMFEKLVQKLTERYGKYVIQGGEDYYYWTRGEDLLTLSYGYDGKVMLKFYEQIPDASV